jgi:hypothetical protein
MLWLTVLTGKQIASLTGGIEAAGLFAVSPVIDY